NPRQRILRLYGLAIDVTSRRQAEVALCEVEQLNQTVLDSIHEHLALIDRNGNIVAVNRAWNDFALNNGAHTLERAGVGTNYLSVCERSAGAWVNEAAAVCAGIKDVLSGLLDHFTLEYPFHAPSRDRWFLLRVLPLSHDRGGAVVTHLDITDRKQ